MRRLVVDMYEMDSRGFKSTYVHIFIVGRGGKRQKGGGIRREEGVKDGNISLRPK